MNPEQENNSAKRSTFLPGMLHILLFVIAILSLLYPALLNGFPFVYSDSGTYISAAPSMHVPVDRPIGYSIFIQLASLKISLWMVVIVQALILYYLVFLIYKYLIPVKETALYSSLTIIFLSLATGMSNYASQLTPDIFVGIMLMVSMLILLAGKTEKLSVILLFIIFQISVISHYSNLLIASMILIIMSALYFRRKVITAAAIRTYMVFIISGWLMIPLINFAYSAGFKLAATANISPAARLVETGIMKDYLDENCAEKSYALCNYKDSIEMDVAWFMWDQKSALYRGGCLERGWGECWKEKDAEFGRLIRDILLTPKYFLRILKMSVSGTVRQLPDFNIGMMQAMQKDSPPWTAVSAHYPSDLNRYESTEQFRENQYFRTANIIQKVVIYLSLLTLIILLFVQRKKITIPLRVRLMILLVFLCILFNAFICATLSSPVDRYEARLIWLLPFVLIISLPFFFPRLLKKAESSFEG